MPILLLGILALFGFGYWYTKKAPLPPGLPPAMPPTATPQQVVTADAPSLANEILDLLYNGRDPRAMHAVASELEKDGFFDAAAILHNRANELDAARAPQSPQAPQGAQAPPPPFAPPPQAPPQAPQGGTQAAVLEAAIRDIRNEVGRIDTLYGTLDRQMRSLAVSAATANRDASWNTAILSWRRFALDFERAPTPSEYQEFGGPTGLLKLLSDFRTTLATWQAEYAREVGLAPVPQQAPAGPTIATQPSRNVPFQAPALSDFGPLGRGGARGRG